MKPVQKYNEKELVALLKQRDVSGFNYLYNNYSGALNCLVRSFIPDLQTGDSVLQDSFVKIWNQIESFNEDKGRLFTWMSSIVRNTCIDVLRSKDYNKSKQNTSLSDSQNEIANGNELNIDAIGLRKFVGLLRDEYKTVVEMCYFDGYSHNDVAEATGIPLGTVKTRLRKALIELRNGIKNK